jgi:hypothetical protein
MARVTINMTTPPTATPSNPAAIYLVVLSIGDLSFRELDFRQFYRW